jgi:acyl carrier protein
MKRSEILDQLRKILIDDLFVAVPAEEIGPDDELGPKVGLDSIGFVEFAVIVSDRFGVNATQDVVARGDFRTLAKVSDFILANGQGARQAG